jgi:hypothetical protein
MTTTAAPRWRALAPCLLVLGILLAAANWYLDPEHNRRSAAAVLFLALLVSPLWVANRRTSSHPRYASGAGAIRHAVAFAALMIAAPLGIRLLATLGVAHEGTLGRRLPMIVLGAFFVVTGNALPKMLTPLSDLRCDAATAQAIQRFSGWAWVLTGLSYAVSWIVLPIEAAESTGILVILAGLSAVVAHTVYLRGTHGEAA